MKKNVLILLSLFLSFAQVGLAQTKKINSKKTITISAPEAPNNNSLQKVEILTEFGKITIGLYNETPLHRDNFIKLVKAGFYDSLLFHRVIKNFMVQGGDPTSKNADTAVMLGSGDNGYKIDPEFRRNLYHKRGALAAARDNNPLKQSSGCQFYIVHGKTFTVEELENIMNNKNLQKKQELFYKYYQTDTVSAKFAELQHNSDKEGVKKYFDEVMLEVDKIYQKTTPLVYSSDQIDTYTKQGGAPHLDGDYTVFGEVISGMEVVDKIAEVTTKTADRPISDIRMKIRLVK